MTGFIIRHIVLLINQKDYEHYLSNMGRISVRKIMSKYRVLIYRRMGGVGYSISAVFYFAGMLSVNRQWFGLFFSM
jgi:hypothetical protein